MEEVASISASGRQILFPGKVNERVITQTFIDVTSRKRKSNEVCLNAEKLKSKKVEKVIKYVAGEDVDSQAGLFARYLDGESQEFKESFSNQSRTVKEKRKFTPEQTASIASGTNLADSAMDKLRTAHNKVFGANPFAGRHKVEKAQNNILTVNRDDWDATEHNLYVHKTGNKVNEMKTTCVFSVKNMKSYIEKNTENHYIIDALA